MESNHPPTERDLENIFIFMEIFSRLDADEDKINIDRWFYLIDNKESLGKILKNHEFRSNKSLREFVVGFQQAILDKVDVDQDDLFKKIESCESPEFNFDFGLQKKAFNEEDIYEYLIEPRDDYSYEIHRYP